MSNTIKTCCELPLTMLSKNESLNDFDFILFHLLEKNVRYYEYYADRNIYKDILDKHRFTILDCSAYEYFVSGESFDIYRYLDIISKFEPDFFILPDVLMSKEQTIARSVEFLNIYKNDDLGESNPLGVIQGNTEQDMLSMLDFYKLHNITNICIPFHNAFFRDVMYDECDEKLRNYFFDTYSDIAGTVQYDTGNYRLVVEDIKYAIGRVWFIIKNQDKLKKLNYIHLLGSHCVIEKYVYKNKVPGLIKSMDTGYPVKCGVEGYELFKEPKKPNIIIDDFINRKDLNESLIELNIHKFKMI